MKKLYGVMAVVLLCVGVSNVQAYSNGENILLGMGTGAIARATSYALKDQSGAENSQAMFGAGVMAAVCILAAQSQDNGSYRGAFLQLATAFGTYVASMYVVRTVNAPAKAQ